MTDLPNLSMLELKDVALFSIVYRNNQLLLEIIYNARKKY